MKAHTIERKIFKALRLVFGRRLGSLKDMPEAKRPAALEALRSARRNLVEYRTAHPELIDARVVQERLAL